MLAHAQSVKTSVVTENGFGGGVCLTGSSGTMSFVNCTVSGTRSGGQLNDGSPVHAVYISGGSPMFSGCTVDGNVGGVDGIILQEGGAGTWSGCQIGSALGFGNLSPVSNGIVVLRNGSHPTFLNTTFANNTSRFGTINFDSSLNGDHQPVLLSNCLFSENVTADRQHGGVAHCTDSTPGRNPLLVVDRTTFSNTGQTNGTASGLAWYETDVTSNYAPSFRLLRDVSSASIDVDTESAGVAASHGDEGDGGGGFEASADLNGDGVVNGQDLAILMGAWTL